MLKYLLKIDLHAEVASEVMYSSRNSISSSKCMYNSTYHIRATAFYNMQPFITINYSSISNNIRYILHIRGTTTTAVATTT